MTLTLFRTARSVYEVLFESVLSSALSIVCNIRNDHKTSRHKQNTCQFLNKRNKKLLHVPSIPVTRFLETLFCPRCSSISRKRLWARVFQFLPNVPPQKFSRPIQRNSQKKRWWDFCYLRLFRVKLSDRSFAVPICATLCELKAVTPLRVLINASMTEYSRILFLSRIPLT